MTARSNESPKEVRSGQQVFEEITVNTERNLAKKLGNSERLEKWGKEKCFAAARREWLDGLRCFAQKLGIGSLYDIHAGVPQTLEPLKDFTLVMLRRAGEPSVTLQNQAAVIYAAAREGDVEFFNKIALALESRGTRKQVKAEAEGSFLAYNILLYWFAGLLWLMNDEAARAALCQYTKRDFTQGAYRMSRERLGLNGHTDRVKRSPVLWYEPEKKIYKYRSG